MAGYQPAPHPKGVPMSQPPEPPRERPVWGTRPGWVTAGAALLLTLIGLLKAINLLTLVGCALLAARPGVGHDRVPVRPRGGAAGGRGRGGAGRAAADGLAAPRSSPAPPARGRLRAGADAAPAAAPAVGQRRAARPAAVPRRRQP